MGSFTATSEAVMDNQIAPDEGSVNPFVPGAPRLGERREYTLRIVAEDAPAAERRQSSQHALRRCGRVRSDGLSRLSSGREPRRFGRCWASPVRSGARGRNPALGGGGPPAAQPSDEPRRRVGNDDGAVAGARPRARQRPSVEAGIAACAQSPRGRALFQQPVQSDRRVQTSGGTRTDVRTRWKRALEATR